MALTTNPGDYVDVAAGLALVGVAGYVLLRRRDRVGLAFAIAIGLHGLAFALRNFVAVDDPLAQALRGDVWGALNWIAAPALVLFALGFPRPLHTRERWRAWVAGAIGAVWALDYLLAVLGTSVLPWGGPLYARAVLFALALAALRYPTVEPGARAALATWAFALAIVLAPPIGAAVLAGSITPAALGTGFWLLLATAILWLAATRVGDQQDRRIALVVALAIPALTLLGLLVRTRVEDLEAVDGSGLYGAGRIVAAILLGVGVVGPLTLARGPGGRDVEASY